MNQVPTWLFGMVLAGAIAAVSYRVLAPRSTPDWLPVEPGTPGGIPSQGLVAGLSGAGFVALVAWLVRWPAVTAIAALVGGAIGCLLDSVIGASLQARRWCSTCEANTEQ